MKGYEPNKLLKVVITKVHDHGYVNNQVYDYVIQKQIGDACVSEREEKRRKKRDTK